MEDYNKAINDAIKAIQNTRGGGCLCGHFDSCTGACKPDKEDFIKAVKKLLKPNKKFR